MKLGIALGAVAIGFLLLIMSGLWSTMFPPENRWTPEKSKRSTEVKERLHNLSFIVNAPRPKLHSGQDIGPLKLEYEELKKEVEQLNADFNSATQTPNTVSRYLKWSGISLAAIGIIAWYAVKQTE
jgi:hypothetical protein